MPGFELAGEPEPCLGVLSAQDGAWQITSGVAGP
jgi:hypothetical protein